jgi:diphthamide biosynthesis protein 2
VIITITVEPMHDQFDAMAPNSLGAPPALSTPDTHLLDLNEKVAAVGHSGTPISEDEIYTRYEIQRTLDEIRRRSWHKVALQFPDEMLCDSARVFQLLARGVRDVSPGPDRPSELQMDTHPFHEQLSSKVSNLDIENAGLNVKLTILADTSYGSCCVDEIAAEHVDADAVVHYGRACLSPTTRLPALHIFTSQSLDREKVMASFKDAFPDKCNKIILTADVAYAHHVKPICQGLSDQGYKGVFAAEIIHDPASPIPNRTVPKEVQEEPEKLKDWRLFHISEPPTSLLLTLSSRLCEIRIYPTVGKTDGDSVTKSVAANSSLLLRRRYALVTSLATVSVWGILINTLSVKNYLHIVELVKSQIAAAGKKSYMFVVGKLNAAKLANFSEVGGWVVIGCWESSLVDSKDFYKPVVTPFELELALRRDEERTWKGDWSADFQRILDDTHSTEAARIDGKLTDEADGLNDGYDSEEESAPPDFDLRTGRYISQTRPMQAASKGRIESSNRNGTPHSSALARRANGDLVAVNGVASPAAEFLKSRRTWKGLGSDFEIAYDDEESSEGGAIQEGRAGIARGYVIGDGGSRT